jgi:hypothetical protein
LRARPPSRKLVAASEGRSLHSTRPSHRNKRSSATWFAAR